MRHNLFPILAIMATLSAKGEIISQPVEYKQGDTVLEGFSVYDNAIQGKPQRGHLGLAGAVADGDGRVGVGAGIADGAEACLSAD